MKQKAGEVTTVYGCYNRIYLDFGVNECLLLTESMRSMVSANSGMVCRLESTALASAARNLLGETCSGTEGARPFSARPSSTPDSSVVPVVLMVSSARLSDQLE